MSTKSSLLYLGEDDYVLDTDAVLGEGSFGVVYHGLQLESGLLVAVKKIDLLKSGGKKEVEKEALILKDLPGHANMVQFLFSEVDERRNAWWLVFQYCELGDLEHYYTRYHPSAFITVELMSHIAYAISFLHNQYKPIIHRDVKPANVLLAKGQHGRVIAKIADLGLAKTTTDSQLTIRARSMVGTVSFFAPEMFRKETYSRAVDVFAAGLVFLGMMKFHIDGCIYQTSCEPCVPSYFRNNEVGKMMNIAASANIPIPDLSMPKSDDPEVFVRVKSLVHNMIAYDPQTRPKARVVANEMYNILESVETHVEKEESPGMTTPITLSAALASKKSHPFHDSSSFIADSTAGYKRLSSVVCKSLSFAPSTIVGAVRDETFKADTDERDGIARYKQFPSADRQDGFFDLDTIVGAVRESADILQANTSARKIIGRCPRRSSRSPSKMINFQRGDIVQITHDSLSLEQDSTPELQLHFGLRGVVEAVHRDYVRLTDLLGTNNWHRDLLYKVNLDGTELESGDLVVLDIRNEAKLAHFFSRYQNPPNLEGETGVVYQAHPKLRVRFPGGVFTLDEEIILLLAKSSECAALVEQLQRLAQARQ